MSSKVKKNCKFFDRQEICKSIQEDSNCYQCPISRCEIEEKMNIKLRTKIDELEKENIQLKIKLAEKIMAVEENE